MPDGRRTKLPAGMTADRDTGTETGIRAAAKGTAAEKGTGSQDRAAAGTETGRKRGVGAQIKGRGAQMKAGGGWTRGAEVRGLGGAGGAQIRERR